MTLQPREIVSHSQLGVKLGKRGLAVILGLGLAVLSGDPGRAQSAGRNYARCIQSCNATMPACLQECSGPDGDCADLFPDDPAAQQACEQACEQNCDDARDECRQVCENIKPPITPEEP